MRFDLITIFPEFFAGPLDHGILRRARQTGLVEVHVQDLRLFTKDRHRTVDDRPFGGGEGMVLKPEPLFEAVESLLGRSVGDVKQQTAHDPKIAIVLMSAAGRVFNQETARRYAQLERIIFICGRYEGVDERVAEHLATEEISIGNFVLSGGGLPAMLVVDAVARLIPGALGNEASSQNESFSESLSSGATFPPAGAQHPDKVPERLRAGGTGAAPRPAETADGVGRRELEAPITNHGPLAFPPYTAPPGERCA